jgi:hypothetical protein
MTNLYQQLQTPAVPDLPNPQERYDRLTVAQTNGALRTFFLKLTNALQSIASPRGGRFLNNPYGAFQDGTDQTAANTTTAYPITFDTTDYTNGVTLSNSSRINVAQAGIYNIQFSVQLVNTTNASVDIDIWFRKNGTNIDKSNSRFGLAARKSPSDPFHIVAAMNLFVSLDTNDYVELMWRPTDVGAYIEHYAASSTPTRPVIPSVITTVTFVSNLSA